MTILAATDVSGYRSVPTAPPGGAPSAQNAPAEERYPVRVVDPKVLGASPVVGTSPRLALEPAARVAAPSTSADEQRDFATGSRMVFMREVDGQKHVFMARGDGTGPVQITEGNAWHMYPDISADGRWLTYVEGSGQNDLSVVLRDLQTGATRKLSTASGMNLHPRFAKDGRSVAYSGPLGPNGRPQIGIVRLDDLRDGQVPPTQVIASDRPCYFPSLSSDGSTVVFQRDVSPAQRELVMHDLASGEERVITTPGPISMAPTLSADGRWVAYTCKVDGDWEIYVTDLRTNETARVTRQAAQDFAPHFRADNTLLFASNIGGNFRIYQTQVQSLDQGQFPIRPLIAGEGDDYAPRTSGLVNIEQRQLQNISEPARSSFGAARVGDRVYIAGGHQGHEHTYPPESFMDRLEYFDLKTKTWGQATPRPVAAHGYGLASDDRYIYAFGGFAYSPQYNPQWKSLDVIDRYDTVTGEWKTIGRMSSPRSSNAVVRVGNNVYLLGGWDSTPQRSGDLEGRFHQDIEVFDLQTGTVSQAPFSLPRPLRRAFTAFEKDGKIIMVGGLGVGSTHFELLDNVTELDPKTGTSRELPRLPFATFAPAAGMIGDTAYVFGGMFKTGDRSYEYVNHVFQHRLGTSAWSHTGRYLSEPKGFAQVVPLDNRTLGILGGHTYHGNDDSPVPTFETFGAPSK